jgi:hypothetical protein
MNDQDPSTIDAPRQSRVRSKGKVIGPKPPLRTGHVWSIRARLQLQRRTRDLALFNLAIDSVLAAASPRVGTASGSISADRSGREMWTRGCHAESSCNSFRATIPQEGNAQTA